MTIELKKGVHWVGVVDWGIRRFHGFELSVHRGTTYNSYLILDRKVAIVDTVWGPHAEEFMDHVRSVIDPARIDYVITNHAEPDHSGGLPTLMRHCPNATVVVSRKGMESVPGHYHQQWKFQAVKTGDKISLGANELVFVEAPMLHWPDSMFTYLTNLNILMPNDAFGQHYASAFRFNDQVNNSELYEEALKYYANILTPFSSLVLKKIDDVLALKLPVDIIAPSHGVIWRKDPLQIVTRYQEWARQVPEKSAVVLYDTMWDATHRMAVAIGDALAADGVPHKLFHLGSSDLNDVLTEVFKAKAIVLGSPTHNRRPLASMAPLLESLRGLKFQNKIGAAFGSYGWGGEAVRVMEDVIKEVGWPLASEGVRALWQPTVADLENCRKLGHAVAAAVLK